MFINYRNSSHLILTQDVLLFYISLPYVPLFHTNRNQVSFLRVQSSSGSHILKIKIMYWE